MIAPVVPAAQFWRTGEVCGAWPSLSGRHCERVALRKLRRNLPLVPQLKTIQAESQPASENGRGV
jgi:hypothetical protein